MTSTNTNVLIILEGHIKTRWLICHKSMFWNQWCNICYILRRSKVFFFVNLGENTTVFKNQILRWHSVNKDQNIQQKRCSQLSDREGYEFCKLRWKYHSVQNRILRWHSVINDQKIWICHWMSRYRVHNQSHTYTHT
jgi:protein associated with RNAse G/E